MIFNFLKNYWKRLNISGEIAVSRFRPKKKPVYWPLDWQSYDAVQSIGTTFAGLYRCVELATQPDSVDQPLSIFLGVNRLGMKKPRPWKCPWTSPKKRKKRTRNENTAMSEQPKVGGKLKLRLSVESSLQKIKSRVEKGAVMIVHVLSGWLASSSWSNQTCFSPTYQPKSFRRICHK